MASITATRKELTTAFNEWQRQAIYEPKKFQAIATEVREFLASELKGEEPTYGDRAVAFLTKMLDETSE